ncbi:hypothetical protein EZS27_037793 [termite gut metagenome]|uniref:Uncharacterized protein n=1 Tax=termite gut metagenome TaxID=433724 RepID=A0A5J4PQD6_9ZZZZ
MNANTFRVVKIVSPELELDVFIFYSSLCRIYGKENIEISYSYLYKPKDKEKIRFKEFDFSTEYWTDIKRELYLMGFDVTVSELDQTLYFDFSDKKDLIAKYELLKQLRKFDIIKSPLDDDFRFKVKTNLIAKKTAKQIFQEKIEKLRGVEFVFDNTKKDDKWRNYVFIGNLNSNESTINQLVFNIPNIFKDFKETLLDLQDKKAKELADEIDREFG